MSYSCYKIHDLANLCSWIFYLVFPNNKGANHDLGFIEYINCVHLWHLSCICNFGHEGFEPVFYVTIDKPRFGEHSSALVSNVPCRICAFKGKHCKDNLNVVFLWDFEQGYDIVEEIVIEWDESVFVPLACLMHPKSDYIYIQITQDFEPRVKVIIIEILKVIS